MAIRQTIADKLAAASKAVANDKSKEKFGAAIVDGRRKLANWIAPKSSVSRVAIALIR